MTEALRTRLTVVQQHLLYWTIYAIYFYVVNVLGNEEMTFTVLLLSLPYFALVFYTVWFILRKLWAKQRYAYCILSLSLFYVVSSIFLWYFLDVNDKLLLVYGAYMISDYTFIWQEFLQTLLVMHCQFSILACLYFTYCGKLEEQQHKLAEMEKRLSLEEEKHRYEYVALAAQVSPHMMANIFQGWSRQLAHFSSAIAEQMMKVYSLMIFYMQAHDPERSQTILLQDELAAVKLFVDAQQEVLNKPVFVSWHCDGNLQRFSIPPTSILTLVKNAFKHGDVYAVQTPLCIRVEAFWDRYRVVVGNRNSLTGPLWHSHGLGLVHLKRRLAMVYGDRASMEVTKTALDHEVVLQVGFSISEEVLS